MSLQLEVLFQTQDVSQVVPGKHKEMPYNSFNCRFQMDYLSGTHWSPGFEVLNNAQSL